MLFIIAENKDQADDYARSINLKRNEYKYVYNKDCLRGRQRGLEFTRVGRWYDHPKINEIDEVLQMLEAVEIFGIKTANPVIKATGQPSCQAQAE